MLTAIVLLLATLDTSRFRLHNVLQPTGWETATIRRDGNELLLESTFNDTDRGAKNDLTTTLRMREDLQPVAFASKGKPESSSLLDLQISIEAGRARINDGGRESVIDTPPRFFTIARFAPVATRELLIRYWKRAPREPLVRLPDRAPIRIEERGSDRVRIHGKSVRLRRYSIEGIIWGAETVWLDSGDRLISLITQGNNQFEAVREGWEPLLPFFVERAAADRMAHFAALMKGIGTRRGATIAITNARIFDGNGVIENGTVVIAGGRIAAVGQNVAIPKRATVIDGRGKTVLPGLWDSHAHFNQVEWGPAYLAAGVTTVRDCGNEFEFVDAVHDAIESERGIGPRIVRAGFLDGDGPNAIGTIRVRDEDEVRRRIERYVAEGFEQIKIYNSVPPVLVPAIVREAHARGRKVTGHIPRGMTIDQALDAGLDQVNHLRFVQNAIANGDGDALIAKLKQRGTVIDPTLGVSEMLGRDVARPLEEIDPAVAKLPPSLASALRQTGRPAEEAAKLAPRFQESLRLVKRLHDSGIPIIAGTDMLLPGHSLHRELELYVWAGLTPVDALRAATSVPARAMGLDGEGGTIAAGKRADVVIVRGNPLERISDVRNVDVVIARGVRYDPARLWRSVGFEP